ncbi:MAG TPA: hypothetical protein VF516_00160 [Kofleriaceae bacterium]
MADLVFNRSKGRVVQFAELINGNATPYVNAAFIIEAINTSATDATLRDLDDFAAIEADGNTAEVTNSGYARKTVTEAASAITITYDDTNDRVDVDLPDQTWTAVGAGTAWTDLVVGFDNDTTGGTDSNILPCTLHDFAITPDGSDITATINVFYRAS